MRLGHDPGAHVVGCATACPAHEVDQGTRAPGPCRLLPDEDPAFIRDALLRGAGPGLSLESSLRTRRERS